ncbi:MAG: hypothetical protein N2257_07700, partial [Thermodesulfovibrionales bacterium]|nr:hypothetical protein [Thermodesulfovibrionales bacterium]
MIKFSSLRTKINLIIIAIIATVMTISWGYNFIDHYKEARSGLEARGLAIARLISGISSYSLLTMDFTLLDEALNRTVEQEEILYIKVLKKDGTVL